MASNKVISLTGAVVLAGFASAATAIDRDFIHIVGSSTVEPFSAAVADQLAKTAKLKRPKLESTGTGGGFVLLCEGVGSLYPDITNASRPIKKKEYEACQRNGVNDIIEVKIGYDGIIFAHAKKDKPISGTRKDAFLALAKLVPDPKCQDKAGECKLIPNPYQTWQQVNPSLPATKIQVFGPAATSGTRDSLNELVFDPACQSFPWLAAKKEKMEHEYKKACFTIREDGAYTEIAEKDDLLVEKLHAHPDSVVIGPYKLLAENGKQISASPVEGVEPSYETIASNRYPLTRTLYFYVKKAHISGVTGLSKFLSEFTSEAAWGDHGYLVSKGLVALPASERRLYAADVKALRPMVFGVAEHATPEPEATTQTESKAKPSSKTKEKKKK